MTTELDKYKALLVGRPNEFDLDVLKGTKYMHHKGALLLPPEGHLLSKNKWSERCGFIFDSFLVITKPQFDDNGNTKYHIDSNPISIELIDRVDADGAAQPRTSGFLKRQSTGTAYPLSIHVIGKEVFNLFTETSETRLEWKAKLNEASEAKKLASDSENIFAPTALASRGIYSAAAEISQKAEGIAVTGRINCSLAFETQDDKSLIAVGSEDGLWIVDRQAKNSPKKVLDLKNVTQCAVLENYELFIVLASVAADKALYAYRIEELIAAPSSSPESHRISGKSNVEYFTAGKRAGRTQVIYTNKKGHDMVFHAIQPRSTNGLEKVQEWFQVYKDFFFPFIAHDIFFLSVKLAVLAQHKFEIVELPENRSVTIPSEYSFGSRQMKRIRNARSLGMFRTGDRFLLCFDEFGCYVNPHGEPFEPTSTLDNAPLFIHWQGKAERVVFHAPYILIFDKSGLFVEVRHIESAERIVQIIQGREIRCTWDGRGRVKRRVGLDQINEESAKDESNAEKTPEIPMEKDTKGKDAGIPNEVVGAEKQPEDDVLATMEEMAHIHMVMRTDEDSAAGYREQQVFEMTLKRSQS